MRHLLLILLCALSIAGAGNIAAQSVGRIPIILDTDFVLPPHDDSMALMLALQSPEIEILGVTSEYEASWQNSDVMLARSRL